MNKLIGLIVFVVVTGAMLGLCANAHIDLFPCESAQRSFVTGRLEKKERLCALLWTLQEHDRGEYDRLTSAGWVALFGFCGGIGAVAGVGAALLLRKKKVAPPAA